jgi:SHS2 domain-containing protein
MMTHNNYEYFEVTADIGVRIWGHGINELFENAALAVTSLMIDPTHIGKIIHRNIQVD